MTQSTTPTQQQFETSVYVPYTNSNTAALAEEIAEQVALEEAESIRASLIEASHRTAVVRGTILIIVMIFVIVLFYFGIRFTLSTVDGKYSVVLPADVNQARLTNAKRIANEKKRALRLRAERRIALGSQGDDEDDDNLDRFPSSLRREKTADVYPSVSSSTGQVRTGHNEFRMQRVVERGEAASRSRQSIRGATGSEVSDLDKSAYSISSDLSINTAPAKPVLASSKQKQQQGQRQSTEFEGLASTLVR